MTDEPDAVDGALGFLEKEDDEEECVFCGERKSAFEFEDGLRCNACREDQDGEE